MFLRISNRFTVLIFLFFFILPCSLHSEGLPFKADNSCGPRCLSAMTRLTGNKEKFLSSDQIYRLMKKESGTPTSMLEILNTAKLLGFKAKGYKLSVDELSQKNEYAIIPLGTTDVNTPFFAHL